MEEKGMTKMEEERRKRRGEQNRKSKMKLEGGMEKSGGPD